METSQSSSSRVETSSSPWAAYNPKALRQMPSENFNFDLNGGAQHTMAAGSSQRESRFTSSTTRPHFQPSSHHGHQADVEEKLDLRFLFVIPLCASLTLWIRRSHPRILGQIVQRLGNLGLLPLTAIGVVLGSWGGRILPKWIEQVQRLRARRLIGTRRDQNRDIQDPWARGSRQEPRVGKGAGKGGDIGMLNGTPANAWSDYGKGARKGGEFGAPTYGKGGRAGNSLSKTPDSRQEYLYNHVEHRLRKRVAASALTDNQIYQLGKQRFVEQEAYFQKLESGEVVVPENGSLVFRPAWAMDGREAFGGRDPRAEKPLSEKLRNPGYQMSSPSPSYQMPESKSWWPVEEYDEPPFWWRKRKDVFFDLPITAEEDLTGLSPPCYQWWDPEKVAESENFVAVSKPPGMFVVTDEKGLWEVSPTNFIHVSHQRFDIGSANEPNQRGICHRLDSHTSGVQIFGRSWEAFRHFTKENSSHRVQKEYLALVDGRLCDADTPGTGMIDVPMIKWKDFDRREFGSIVCGGEGLPAVSKYKALRQWKVPAKGKLQFLKEDRWFTLVQLRIMSGRTHQIRVHMAIIGHPLVGDIKYNQRNFEHDSAIVPRIFLHCLKMEFKEFDESLFVASSELAPDLQAVLKYIDYMSKTESGSVPLKEDDAAANSDDLPGLGRILADSQSARVEFPLVPEGTADAFCSRTMTHRCLKCMGPEDMTCTMIQRKGKVAMSWSLRASADSTVTENLARAPNADQLEAVGEPKWGPGMLWVPTQLQLQERSIDADLEREAAKTLANSDNLDARWKAHGIDWSWAHNGTTKNGWFRLCDDGILESKWGPGVWEYLRSSTLSLLLVTFNGTEHALRLMEGDEGRFEVMSKRKIRDGEKSLREDPDATKRAMDATILAACATRGWPNSTA